ncbi:hypothetical protein SteCoe_19149 [Stentor coeruleus]|uniref:UBL3-like ubiquitin domain-containing protein n=1 Tax=Stentor coeruleus TaxID=5963 RepID=A0A1R2BUR9_9CILI|nr:hypothetical protein SteCoe_19149 [Stentor coeruleus]
MISLNFIFPNTDQRIVKKYKSTDKIYQIKESLLSNLPSNINKNTIDYMRFFSMGKELSDSKTLSAYPLPDPSHPMPIHVHLLYLQTARVTPMCCDLCYIL